MQVLENFHVASLFQIMRRPERNIMSGWPRQRCGLGPAAGMRAPVLTFPLAHGPRFVEARRSIIELILATDFAEHKRILGEFDKARRRGGSLDSAMKQAAAAKQDNRGGSMHARAVRGGPSPPPRHGPAPL